MLTVQIPRTIAKEIGCHPTMIDKVNRGLAQASPKLCAKIIKAMKGRGVKVTLFDLRPDLKEIMMESL